MSLAWITNLSAPYRWPVWQTLAEASDFCVGLLGDSEPNRRWSNSLPDGVAGLPLRSWQLAFGRTPLYTMLRPALKSLPAGSAVVLPGWENPAAWQLLAECRLRRISTVAFYESTERSQRHSRGLVGRLRRIFFTHVDAVLTVGRASTSAVQHLGVKPGRIVVTHNSVDLDVYKSADIHSPVLPRGTSFAYVGQLLERKNVLTLIDALTLMPDECTLDVVGEGPLDSAVRCAIDEGGLHDRVTLHGYLEPISVAALLGRVGTLVLPSTEEVYGLAPAEALAAGLHVVVSDKAGIAPDIDTMDGVWICEPTVDALAAAMRSSTLAWSGPIKSPAIREWTAGRFAQDVLTAADIARHRTI